MFVVAASHSSGYYPKKAKALTPLGLLHAAKKGDALGAAEPGERRVVGVQNVGILPKLGGQLPEGTTAQPDRVEHEGAVRLELRGRVLEGIAAVPDGRQDDLPVRLDFGPRTSLHGR